MSNVHKDTTYYTTETATSKTNLVCVNGSTNDEQSQIIMRFYAYARFLLNIVGVSSFLTQKQYK